MNRRIVTLLFAVCALLFVAKSGFCTEYNFSYQRMVELEKPVLVDIELVKGKVVITGSDENSLIINATKIIRASNEDEAEEMAGHVEIKVKKDGDKVRIRTNYLNLLNRSPSFWQKILGGDSKSISEVVYNISLPFNCDIKIKAMDADVELANIESNVVIEKSTGITRGEFVFGSVEISQPMGEIDLQWIEGDIDIRSETGKISIRQTRGAIRLFTYNGNVDIQTEFDSPSEFVVESTTGNIRFAVPMAAAGELHLETETGEFTSDMPVEIVSLARNRVVGLFGGGGTKVRLNSSSGNVFLAQY